MPLATLTRVYSDWNPLEEIASDEHNGELGNVINHCNNVIKPQVDANTVQIATNVTDIAGNAADIGTNVTQISTNTGNINTNDVEIATNIADIAALQGMSEPYDWVEKSSSFTFTAPTYDSVALITCINAVPMVITFDTATAFTAGKRWWFTARGTGGVEITGSGADFTLATIFLAPGESVCIIKPDEPPHEWAVLARGSIYNNGVVGMVTKTGVGTLNAFERLVKADLSGGAYTLTLPDLSSDTPYGLTFTIMGHDHATNKCTVAAPSGQRFFPDPTPQVGAGEVLEFVFLPQTDDTSSTAAYNWLVRGT